ncbi:MAG: pilus assembly PilX N-terminal domain-containing protein [Deltaproteobacteria bacterium]|nr:pilus assembly PilX N-terminal domain-containing protein [Deltaproteobacteria bacterium]
MVVALVLIAILTLLGTSGYLMSTTDLQISGAYRDAKAALYNANAGVHFALGAMENGLAEGTFTLPETADEKSYLSCFNAYFSSLSLPEGFSFTLEPKDCGPIPGDKDLWPYFTFVSHGRGPAGARCSILARFKRRRDFAIDFGAFADYVLDFKNSGSMYSYDSRDVTNPTGEDSTREGDICSNGEMFLYNSSLVDGSTKLGTDLDGLDGHITEFGTPGPEVSGIKGDKVGRVNPDPLGARDGWLADEFVAVKAHNNNKALGLSNKLNLRQGESLTLTAGNYYFTDIRLHNGSTLDIDTSGGPVQIYLSGKLVADNGAVINLSGDPPDFTIYSDSDDDIIFKNGSDLRGLVYAPFANLEIKNSGDVFGSLWGCTLDVKNRGELYFDTRLKDRWVEITNEICLLAWKELRD